MFKRLLIFAALCLSVLLLAACSVGGTDIDSTSEAAVTDPPAETLPSTLLGAEGEPVTLPDGDVCVAYTVNSSAAGSLIGRTVQQVDRYGVTKSRISAKANLGYRFVCWSDGLTDPSREKDTAETSRVITAIFDYDLLDMPVFVINTETGGDVESKTEYIKASLTVADTEGKTLLTDDGIEIRGRGNNTWSYEKKSYKVKLTEKTRLCGLGDGKERVWVLLANHCDQSLLRNHTVFGLCDMLTGIDFAPDSKPVEVYLNGEYRGVYLLAEEIRVSSDRVDIEDATLAEDADTGYLVELSAYAQGDVFYIGNRQYQIRSELSSDSRLAQKQSDYIINYMNLCWNAVNSGNEARVRELIDIDSFVDTYIAEELSKNLDLGWDSFYFHKNGGGKLCFGPIWDFDLSLGNSNESCEYYYDLYAGAHLGNPLGNPWYQTMMLQRWFRQLVLDRWDEIRDRLFELPDGITAEAEAGYRSFCRNFERWKIFGTCQNRETEFITSLSNYKEHYTYLSGWTENRIKWIDEYMHTDAYINGAFTGQQHKPRR